jgi:aminoglycoside phosphotransferase family enzyme
MIKRNAIEKVTENIIPLTEKVSFLKQPKVYPHPVVKVETKETHTSWVFLVDDFAYKLKKPVLLRFLDLRTLEARLKNCREEIRLNKRLAADLYVGIVSLVLNEEGKLQIEGKGLVIEWLVKMKRIPEENLLDYAIRHQRADEALVKAAAMLLAEFYKNALPVYMERYLYRKELKDEIISTHTDLLNPLYHLPIGLIEQISNNLIHFLNNHYLMFDKRVANGKIIEAHGDLKPEHICLLPQPAIIDALEFNRELRVMDIAEELSFFEMECEMMGDLVTGQLFFDCYKKMANDNIPESLIFFYKTKKALLRTWLVARHIMETGYKEQPKWLKRANTYLQLAKKYNHKLSG